MSQRDMKGVSAECKPRDFNLHRPTEWRWTCSPVNYDRIIVQFCLSVYHLQKEYQKLSHINFVKHEYILHIFLLGRWAPVQAPSMYFTQPEDVCLPVAG